VNVMEWLTWNVFVSALVLFMAFTVLWTLLLHFMDLYRKKQFSFRGMCVVVTGGSQGLGRELACQLAKSGANVVIISRNQKNLDEARNYILSQCPQIGKEMESNNLLKKSQQILSISADVTKANEIREGIKQAEQQLNRSIDMLIACAGAANPGYFGEFKDDDFVQSMNLNYFGSLFSIRAVVPSMMERRSGHLVLVSSGLGLTSYMGYTTYVPTKYALRGLGDSLRTELKPYNIKVYQAYPPAFHSPGFERENKNKPKPTVAIESSEPVFRPEDIAAAHTGRRSQGSLPQ